MAGRDDRRDGEAMLLTILVGVLAGLVLLLGIVVLLR
jgi:hypothetical protein